MLTNEQRENRALYNLSRARANERGPMTTGQLHCASVRTIDLDVLVMLGAIKPADFERDGVFVRAFQITNAGDEELRTRIFSSRGSTITWTPRPE